jgi:MFS family permease
MELENPELELIATQEREIAHRTRGLFFVSLACGAVGFAMALQMGLNPNFLADVLKLSGQQVGLLEAARESCGIFALGLLALLAGLGEPLVGCVVLVVFALGLGGYGLVPPAFSWVLLLSLVWSQGLHIWMPLPNSMTLALAEPGRAGRRLGQVQAAAAAGFGLGLLSALVLSRCQVPIQPMYVIAGVAGLLGAGACLGIPRAIKTPGPRFVVRRKYALYYLLCFLEGWRKQVAIAFAGFLLVKQFGASLEVMLLLQLVVQVISYFASRPIGKLIDRVGERRVLTIYYLCLTLFFIGYATLRARWALYSLFVLDNAIFVLGMAVTTYVGRIAPQEEHTPTLSMGVAMNHVAAVSMPLLGGVIWKVWGYQYTFAIGALAALLSVLLVRFVPARAPMHEQRTT